MAVAIWMASSINFAGMMPFSIYRFAMRFASDDGTITFFMYLGKRVRIFLNTEFSNAIRLNPQYADAYNSRGFVYYKKKDYNRAIADFEAALRINPNHASAKENLEDARKARGEIMI